MMSEQNNRTSYSKNEMVQGLVTQISAYIEQYHGGSVEFISFENDDLKVRLGGACVGCPMSASTLRGYVEGQVKVYFPGVTVTGVE